MPEITSSTPRESYTIASETFSVPLPYSAGDVLTMNEAAALNQTWAENARNNFAKRVSEAKAAGTFSLEVFQGQLDDYLDSYEFGVRTGGGRSGDPVMVEAMNIARDLVRKKMVEAGHKLKDVTAAQISSLAKQAIDSGRNPQIMELALKRVESAKEITSIQIDSLDEGEEVEEAPRGKRKA